MKRSKKSFKEKLFEKKDLPKIVDIPEKWQKRYGIGKMVIPHPTEVYEIMGKVPKGKIITIPTVRKILAKKHGVVTACPLTTGIFSSIAANASIEISGEGNPPSIPYWRTLKKDGEVNPKFPGGIDFQEQMLNQEGIPTYKKGKKVFVKEFEKYEVEDISL